MGGKPSEVGGLETAITCLTWPFTEERYRWVE
jgi:hypothetical protein